MRASLPRPTQAPLAERPPTADPGPSAHAKTAGHTAGPQDYNRICAVQRHSPTYADGADARSGSAKDRRRTAYSRSAHLVRRAIPLRIIAPDSVAAGVQRMAAVALKRFFTVVLVVAPKCGESLHGGSRQAEQEFGELRAPPHVGEHFTDRAAEPLDQVQADQLPIDRPDGVATAGVRHPVGTGFRLDDIERGIDGDAYAHLVHRIT